MLTINHGSFQVWKINLLGAFLSCSVKLQELISQIILITVLRKKHGNFIVNDNVK